MNRAAAFAEDWKDAAYEKGETQSFYNAIGWGTADHWMRMQASY